MTVDEQAAEALLALCDAADPLPGSFAAVLREAVPNLLAETAALSARLARAEAALREYGRHKEGCWSAGRPSRQHVCTCGLTGALADSAALAEPGEKEAACQS